MRGVNPVRFAGYTSSRFIAKAGDPGVRCSKSSMYLLKGGPQSASGVGRGGIIRKTEKLEGEVKQAVSVSSRSQSEEHFNDTVYVKVEITASAVLVISADADSRLPT